nr:NADH dehydrogenase subunit 5 [Parabathippus shelfordi]
MLILMSLIIPSMLGFMFMNNNMFLMLKLMLTSINSSNMFIDMMMDWMSLTFMSTVMLISSLIILFSKYYIPIKEQKQFLIMLLMFILSMIILILSNNLFLILLGWDGLGLSSYILVMYYQNFSSASSGTITLLSNRIGDIMILMSIAMLIMTSNWSFNLNFQYPMIIMIMLLIAASSKSAQFPFSAWLPMAMAAPTPISALVHSSTLVTAGVFIMMRIMSNNPNILTILLIISTATALYASMSANWEQDLKKIIALSTLSQIAMMMFAISLGSLILAYLHLIIHALFKSTMFLCAGIMIHESTYQDMRMMGLNFSNHPLTLSIFGLNSMALMGIPFMSGFFSKDMILEKMSSSNLNFMMLILMTSSVGMTASYSLRMSISSNKSIIKFNPLSLNHSSTSALIPIISLSSFGIMSGSSMTWLISPHQMFMISYTNKMLVLLILSLGFMMGILLQFKNKKYTKLGSSSISLWFTHFLSVIPNITLSSLMGTYLKNDKSWQENYGPQKSFNMLKMSSPITDNFKYLLLMSTTMMIMIPFIIL